MITNYHNQNGMNQSQSESCCLHNKQINYSDCCFHLFVNVVRYLEYNSLLAMFRLTTRGVLILLTPGKKISPEDTLAKSNWINMIISLKIALYLLKAQQLSNYISLEVTSSIDSLTDFSKILMHLCCLQPSSYSAHYLSTYPSL